MEKARERGTGWREVEEPELEISSGSSSSKILKSAPTSAPANSFFRAPTSTNNFIGLRLWFLRKMVDSEIRPSTGPCRR